jgi:UDP-glucose 4-epimerase
MKVLITGGAGYVGTELVHALLLNEQIREIVVYDNLSRQHCNFFIGHRKFDSRVRFRNADILDGRSLSEELKGVDVVVHLAANVQKAYRDLDVDSLEQVNNWGSSELVNAIESQGVARSIYLSSSAIYGFSEALISMQHVPAPVTAYGISKHKGERHFDRLLKKGHEGYIIRSANVFGYSRSMRFDGVMNRFVFDANFKRKLCINGNGSQRRPFISVEQLVDVLVAAVSGSLQPGYYNAVDSSRSLNDIVEVLFEIYPDLELIYANQDMPVQHMEVEASTELAELIEKGRDELGMLLRDFVSHFTFQV